MTFFHTDYTVIIYWLDLIGTFVFGLSGGTLAVRRQLDLFGVIVLATAAASAGGVIRDVMLGAQPAALLQNPSYLFVTFASGLSAFFFHRQIERLNKPVMLLDALGLGVFAVAGTQKALAFGLHPAAACVVGVLTAVGGGVVRDLLVTEVPRVLREEVYAVAAILGSILVVIGLSFNWSPVLTTLTGVSATFAIRVLSVRLGLRIPRAH